MGLIARKNGPASAILRSGTLDRLKFWQAFGVKELWLWKNGRLKVYGPITGGYEPLPASRHLPNFDLALVEELVTTCTDLTSAVREYRRRRGSA
ncbi:MAG: hypothetical protein ACR2OZ_16145 [Verrucomicrobiales bacterium]